LERTAPGIELPSEGGEDRCSLWLDIGEDQGNGLVYTYRNIKVGGDDTVEKAMDRLPMPPWAPNDVVVPEDLIRQCVRLMLSICFLVADDDPDGTARPAPGRSFPVAVGHAGRSP
jgi:hypothetical protein